VSGKTTSLPIIATRCWLARSCSHRRNGYLAGLGVIAFGQNGWSWDIVNNHH